MPSQTSPAQYAATAASRTRHDALATASTVRAAQARVRAIVKTFGAVARLVVAQQEHPGVAQPRAVSQRQPARAATPVTVFDLMLRR
jgi:hypothetical protein